jgi:hypothetical protein
MTTPEDKKAAEPGHEAAAKKKRPETLADFMELDTFIGVVNGSDDPDYGRHRVSASKIGEEYADSLMEQYHRQQEEFAKYLRDKEQPRQ